MRLTRRHLALTALAALAPRTASAADYPAKQIRLIVMFTPGGPTDLLARGLARALSAAWGQTVIVENRPGAGGILTSNTVLEAPRDGYTLGVYSDAFSIAPAIYAKLPYDPGRDFIPIAELASAANVVVTAASSPLQSLADVVQRGKTAAKLSYASAGIGSAMHMQAAVFSLTAHLDDPLHIPFKGTPESLNDVMAGRVDIEFAPLANAVPLIKAGKLRALAVSTAERSPFLPDIPTIAEAGVPGFAMEQWFGVFAATGVPPDVIAKLETGIAAALQTPPMQDLVRQLSSTPGTLIGPPFQHFVAAQITANTAAAKAGHITAQ